MTPGEAKKVAGILDHAPEEVVRNLLWAANGVFPDFEWTWNEPAQKVEVKKR